MKYTQLTPENTFVRFIEERGNILWDSTHFCPVDKLTPEEAMQFNVVKVTEIPQPTFDPDTHECTPNGAEFINGVWQTTWLVSTLSDEVLAARAKSHIPRTVSPRQIRQALTRAGLRTSVEETVATGDQDIKDWYEFATAFERDNKYVVAMSVTLGVTEQQLDDLFILAGGL